MREDIYIVYKKDWNSDFDIATFEEEKDAIEAIKILEKKDTKRQLILEKNKNKEKWEADEYVWSYSYKSHSITSLDNFKEIHR